MRKFICNLCGYEKDVFENDLYIFGCDICNEGKMTEKVESLLKRIKNDER